MLTAEWETATRNHVILFRLVTCSPATLMTSETSEIWRFPLFFCPFHLCPCTVTIRQTCLVRTNSKVYYLIYYFETFHLIPRILFSIKIYSTATRCLKLFLLKKISYLQIIEVWVITIILIHHQVTSKLVFERLEVPNKVRISTSRG